MRPLKNIVPHISKALMALLLMSMLSVVHAWTGSGHRRVAMLAWSRLTPEAQKMATYLLNSGDDAPGTNCKTAPFDVAASWLDCQRERGAAAVMHADRTQLCPNVNIPTGCKTKHCATDALKQAILDLNDKNSSIQKRRIALKIIMHLVGDLHQPLHAAQAADPIHNGGTMTILEQPNTSPIILHQYWDYNVIKDLKFHKDHLDRLILTNALEWEKGTVDEWVHQTVEEASGTVYREPLRESMCDARKMMTPILLTKSYMELATAYADYKIAQAGVRLALILNQSAAKSNKWLYPELSAKDAVVITSEVFEKESEHDHDKDKLNHQD